MGAVLPPVCDGNHTNVDSDDTFNSQPVKDEERCAMGTPLPPYDGDDDADKTASSRTSRARVFLALGLALELSATLSAFQQAVSAGALNGDTDCITPSVDGVLYISSLVVGNCDGPIDANSFYDFTGAWDAHGSTAYDEQEFVVCDSLTDVPTGRQGFAEDCDCDLHGAYDKTTPCSWVALSIDGVCLAHGLNTNSKDGTIVGFSSPYELLDCIPKNPSGTVDLTITALVVALSSQLLEAFVGFKYWKGTATKTVPTLAASILEAVGVVVVSSVLLSLPGFYTISAETTKRLPVVFLLAWTSVTSVIVGALAEITAECSGKDTGIFPYIRVVGNGLIWLGAALLEVVVTSYLLWEGANQKDVTAMVRESAGLLILEVLGLVAMWIARGLWERAKLLRASVKSLDLPLRKTFSTHFK